jgi:hypothetical protein
MRFSSLLISSLLLLLFTAGAPSDKKYLRQIKKHRKQVHKEFSNPETSPFRDKATTDYHGLDYFPANPAYRVEAQVVRTTEATPFSMPTSNPDRDKPFVKYAVLRFELAGEAYELSAYTSLNLVTDPKYASYLFVPFTDLTTGSDCYGGGRYLDLETPAEGESITLDFNLCYNPYCAYSLGWSCPIPPEENFLNLRLEAGVKDYGK